MEVEVANDILDGAGTDVTTKVVSEQRRLELSLFLFWLSAIVAWVQCITLCK